MDVAVIIIYGMLQLYLSMLCCNPFHLRDITILIIYEELHLYSFMRCCNNIYLWDVATPKRIVSSNVYSIKS